MIGQQSLGTQNVPDERPEQVFEVINQPAKGKTCDAINGMVDESQKAKKS
jgi:ferritin-like metal-binding protein YciE